MSNFNKGLTLEELMALAQGNKQAPESRNEAELFFDELNIVDGPNWVDFRLVYWKYLKWCSEIGREPIERKLFNRGAQARFKKYTAGGRMYFKLHKEVFAVSKQEWEEILRDYNLERGKLEWRKKLKIAQKERRKREKKEKKEALKREKELRQKMRQEILGLKKDSSQE